MKVSASIELIWQLAGQEAIAAEFREIEPEHFLMSLLKFSEMRASELEKLGAGSEAVQALVTDMGSLQQELQERGLDSGAVRRELRRVLGRGSDPYEGGQIHRAQATRECFDKAATTAADAGSDTLMGAHLLRTILESPTPAIAQVLAEAGGARPQGKPEQPLVKLYEYGKDLNRLTAEQKLGQDNARLAEAKAVLRILGLEQRNSAFLVTDDVEVARKIAFTVARLLSGKDVPAELRGKRIIDLSEPTKDSTKAVETSGLLEKLLVEAAGIRGVILYLPAISPQSQHTPTWVEALHSLASGGKIQFVARAPVIARAGIEKDPGWRRTARIVNVANEKMDDIPGEL